MSKNEGISDFPLFDYTGSANSEDSYTVLFPSELKEEKYIGPLYGYYVLETRIFNVTGTVPHLTNTNVRLLGHIYNEPQEYSNELTGLIDTDGNLSFYYNERSVTVSYYSLVRELFSRNAGILESDAMLKKRACIIGCGSGGSLVAVELAKAGVGSFVLCDNDIFAYHNICRHQLDIFDVGKRKVDALREKILSINPCAEVITFASRVEDIYLENLAQYLTENTILVNCSDMRSSAHYANFLSEKYNIPFVAVAGGIRASTGEIFYYIPGLDMPCYACFCGADLDLDTSNHTTRLVYANEEATFNPGIGIDIDFVNLIACKVIIDLLMRNEDGYLVRLLPRNYSQNSSVEKESKMSLEGTASDVDSIVEDRHPLYHGMGPYTLFCNYPAQSEDELNPEHPNYNPIQEYFDSPLDFITTGKIIGKRENCYLCKMIADEKSV